MTTPVPEALVDVVCKVTSVFARLLEIVAAEVASTVRFSGSTSHAPNVPFAADVSTRMPPKLTVWPEVSTEPPLPPFGPPLALSVPATVVKPSDQTTI